ncbi:hypothetical protein MMC31_006568, partial [Peltigera leucophlebia]|nr:hypothetical protein [Peltigera leucophlebia]
KKIVDEESSFHVAFSLKGIPVMDKFVGRNTEITRLAQLLISSSTNNMQRKVCLLHGIGGVGKSQLAAEFARKHQENFSAIFWIAGSSKEKLRRSIAALAQRLPQHQIPEMARSLSTDTVKDLDAIVEIVLKWFSRPSNNKWLLIFDNVDREYSAQSKDPEEFDIKKYLPDADHGSILITSRLASMWRLAGSDIKLEPFNELQGELLLNSIVQKPLAGSLELVNLLQGLPLAIDQAGSYIRETGTNALEYMKLYEETWAELMTQQHQFALEEAPASSILTTWTISFNDLQKRSPDAANLLTLWSFLDNQDIWYEQFTPLGSEFTEELPDWFSRCVNNQFEFKKCTRFLIRYSFVTGNIESSSFSVHSVLHRWCFHNADKRKNQIAWLAIMVVASAAPKKSDVDYTLLQRRLLPHCNCVCSLLRQSIPENIPQSSELSLAFHRLATLYLDQGKMAEAEAMYLRALAGKEKAWGPDHTSTLDTVNYLGALYSDQGKMAEAEAMFLRALAGKEKAWGPDHTSTLDTVNNLGIFYRKQGKMAEAEAMYLRALAGFEKAWGPDHTSTLVTVNNLGILYAKQGKMAEAEAMAGCEKAWGPDHTSILDTVNNLGLLYSNQGKTVEAEAMYLRAIAGYEKVWGPDHTSTLETVNNLGNLYTKQGKMAEAEAMYLRALAGLEKAWGPDHKSTLDTRYNLAHFFEQNLMLSAAAKHYELVVQGYTKLLGPKHSKTVDASDRLKGCEDVSNGTGDVAGNRDNGDGGSDGGGDNDGDGNGDGDN